jgi:uncharacterized protein YciI
MRTAPVLFRTYEAAEGDRNTVRRRVDRHPQGAEYQHMGSTFIVTSAAGSNRDHANGTRDQPYWDDHAAFIDNLVEEGFIMLGGPLPDEGGAVLVVHAGSETEVRDRLGCDPWYAHEILTLESVRRWDIFIDRRVASGQQDPSQPQ